MLHNSSMAYSTSASDRLAAVRASIDNVLSSQEYGVGSRRNRRAELSTLFKMEQTLIAQVEAESGGMVTVARIDRPT